VTFDAGPFGFRALAAHAHCDALAVNIAIGGHPIFVDRGTFRYSGDPATRDRFRLTAAHNTVQAGTREQADPAGPFLWSRTPTIQLERCELGGDLEIVQASHDGFSPHTHRRTLVHRDGLLLIIDTVDGHDPLTSRFHGAPGVIFHRDHDEVVFASASGLPLGWWATRGADVRLVETEHSDRYARAMPATTIESVSSQRTLITVLGTVAQRSAIDILARARAAGVLRSDG
jgi:uncharacterized heparinase superfamily protein